MVAETQEEVICPLPGIAVDREKEPLSAFHPRECLKSLTGRRRRAGRQSRRPPGKVGGRTGGNSTLVTMTGQAGTFFQEFSSG